MNTISLGYYQMAYRISIIPITEFSDVVGTVTFPVFAKIRGNK
jgi:O-antigen/teichoic acid export membrane protein